IETSGDQLAARLSFTWHLILTQIHPNRTSSKSTGCKFPNRGLGIFRTRREIERAPVNISNSKFRGAPHPYPRSFRHHRLFAPFAPDLVMHWEQNLQAESVSACGCCKAKMHFPSSHQLPRVLSPVACRRRSNMSSTG